MTAAEVAPLTATAADLQQLLGNGSITSVQIVEAYLAHIEKFNPCLKALISVAPRENVLAKAAALDDERARGSVRSPYHGIPIVLKDSIMTAPELGMPTTVGSWAFAEAKCKAHAPLVQKLVDAGLIILGKANLTEFCGFKTTWIMPGWSAYGGQTLSPYVGRVEKDEKVLGHSSPGGSSSGPAVAVASGFSPLSIGTETIGSIMVPASRAALYAIKATVGDLDMNGIFSLSAMYDSAGPLAKTPAELAPVLEILLGRPFSGTLQKDWSGLSVGFVDPKAWNLDETMCRQYPGTAEEMVDAYEAAVSRIREAGGDAKYPINAPDLGELTVDGKQALMPIAFWDFKNKMVPDFLAGYDQFPLRSLADIVKYNEENKEKTLPPPFPDQSDLAKAAESTTAEEEINPLKEGFRAKAIKLLDAVFDKEGVDVIAGPTDGGLLIHGAASGFPTANVPLGTLSYNGRPYGICLIARAKNEEALMRFMSAYEAATHPRPVPDLIKLQKDLESTSR